MDAGGIAGKHHSTASDKTDQATYDDARKGELAMPALEQIPAAYTYREYADELVSYVLKSGYTHIELMPISEYPSDESPDSEYLVSRIHKLDDV